MDGMIWVNFSKNGGSFELVMLPEMAMTNIAIENGHRNGDSMGKNRT